MKKKDLAVMQMLRSNRLTNAEYWEEAKERILKDQREELADNLFSIPEGVWHNIRWHSDVDIQKANSSAFNVSSALYIDISDPLELENILQGKLNRAYRRLSIVEALCCDMYHVIYGEDTSTETCNELRQRMADLGLLEVDE